MTTDRPIVFTRHARNHLRRTKLAQDELLVLLDAHETEHRDGSRINRWIWHLGNWLRVVLVEEPDAIVVIAVIWPARPPREPS
ncbi:MAG: hypothetical protein WEC75_08385 [Dehalococcoidia bacterium]